MRIVLDENLPRPLIRIFDSRHSVTTVVQLGLSGITNGQLLTTLEGQHDVLLTGDKNLRYQQNLAGRSLAIVELPTNRLPVLNAMSAAILLAVESVVAGAYIVVELPDST